MSVNQARFKRKRQQLNIPIFLDYGKDANNTPCIIGAIFFV